MSNTVIDAVKTSTVERDLSPSSISSILTASFSYRPQVFTSFKAPSNGINFIILVSFSFLPHIQDKI